MKPWSAPWSSLTPHSQPWAGLVSSAMYIDSDHLCRPPLLPTWSTPAWTMLPWSPVFPLTPHPPVAPFYNISQVWHCSTQTPSQFPTHSECNLKLLWGPMRPYRLLNSSALPPHSLCSSGHPPFLKRTKHTPTSGPLHLLFPLVHVLPAPLPPSSPLDIHMAPSLKAFYVSAKM